jgi:hypothetical protein
MNAQCSRVAAPPRVTEGNLTAVEVERIRILLTWFSGQVRAVGNRRSPLEMPVSRGRIGGDLIAISKTPAPTQRLTSEERAKDVLVTVSRERA